MSTLPQQQRRFVFPDSVIGILSGAVNGVPPAIGDRAVTALQAICTEQELPLLATECHFVAPTRRGAAYGTIPFRFAAVAPLDCPAEIERLLKEKLLSSIDISVDGDQVKHINVVAGCTELSGVKVDTANREDAIVVDTDAVSRLLKGDTRAVGLKNLLDSFEGRKIISFQTQAELYVWIIRRGFSEERRNRLQNLLKEFEVAEPDDRCSLIWANLVTHGRVLGRPTAAQDMWVAALAIRHGAKLCTANVKDYDHLPQLQLHSVTNVTAKSDVKDLCIQSFLREHGKDPATWDKLRQSLFIVRSEVHPSLVLFNVKQSARSSDPGNRVYGCRGLILDEADNYRIVNYPFNSFFNLGERQSRPIAKNFDWSTAIILPKLDGTLMSLYYYDKKFHVSTRGHPDAATSTLEKGDDGMSFATLFWKTWNELGYNLPPQQMPWIHRTYCFELLTPENRVVVPIGKPRIVLIMVRDLDTLEELPCGSIATMLGWETVEPEPPVTGPDELRDRANELSPVEGEGFVAVDPSSWNRLKVKSKRYLLASTLPRPNWGWTSHQAALSTVDDAQVMKIVLAGESDEFAAYFPEWATRFLEMRTKLNLLVDQLEPIINETLQNSESMKEVNHWLRACELPSGLMGFLMKTLSNQRSGSALRAPDRNRLLELLCVEPPIRLLFWSNELASVKLLSTTDKSTPAAAAVESDPKKTSGTVGSKEPRELTRSWNLLRLLPFFTMEQVLVSVVIFAASFLSKFVPLPNITVEGQQTTAVYFIVALVAFILGADASNLQRRVRQLLVQIHARQRSRKLHPEMQRVAALYENVYSLETLTRKAILEGFLRRLSESSHKYSMVLRGSLLTQQIVHPMVRDAQDLDFVSCFPWEQDDLVGGVLQRILEVCSLPNSDGVSFGDRETISGKVTWGDTEWPGVKVTFPMASLYGHIQMINIDVGFGDPLEPQPFILHYRVLPVFHASDSLRLLAVRPELMFAWKVHGLFEHNTINDRGQDVQGYWRIKDMYDLWLLARVMTSGGRDDIPVRLKYIGRAIEVAFASRDQDPCLVSRLLSHSFGGSSGSQRRWRKFRSESPSPDEIPLQLHFIIEQVVEFMEPLVREMLRRRAVETESMLAPETSLPSNSRRSWDASAMITDLPGCWTVFKKATKVEYEGISFEQLTELLKGSTCLRFGKRPEQFEVVKIKPIQGLKPGFVVLKDMPTFTMRNCVAQLISRRSPSSEMSDQKSDVLGSATINDTAASFTTETPQNEEERVVVEEGKHLLSNRLARRLDALPPLHRIVYVTSSWRKYVEARKCLAEIQEYFEQGPPDVKPPVPGPGTLYWRGPEAAVRSMARYCFDILQTPCLVDLTFLEVTDPEGGPPAIYLSPEIESKYPSVQNFIKDNHGRSAVLRSFFGYLSSGSGRVLLFEGMLEGHIRRMSPDDASLIHATGEPEFPLPTSTPILRDRSLAEMEYFETAFVPEGYSVPLVEMSDSNFCLNVHHIPLLELAQSLRGRDYGNLFEVHVTVKTLADENARTTFQKHCSDLSEFGFPASVKPVLIENESGEIPTQMMTASYHRGTLGDVHLQAFRLSQALVRAGYVISRTKIESLLSNLGVPVTDEEAARLSPDCYFEFHIKLRLAGDAPLKPLQAIAERHGAHLSRNALSKSVEQTKTWQRRFVNLRLYQVGRDTALARFQACVDELEEAGYAIEKLVREYSVYDSNVALDRGWIDKEQQNT